MGSDKEINVARRKLIEAIDSCYCGSGVYERGNLIDRIFLLMKRFGNEREQKTRQELRKEIRTWLIKYLISPPNDNKSAILNMDNMLNGFDNQIEELKNKEGRRKG